VAGNFALNRNAAGVRRAIEANVAADGTP